MKERGILMTMWLLLVLVLATGVEAEESCDVCSIDTMGHSGPLLPQYDVTGALRITKDSLDAILKDHPEAKLRIQVVDYGCEAELANQRSTTYRALKQESLAQHTIYALEATIERLEREVARYKEVIQP